MAIAKLNEVPVNIQQPVIVAQIQRKTKREKDGTVIEVADDSGTPRWVIDGLVPLSEGMATISVTVTAAEKPNPGPNCRFVGLVARPYGIAQAGGRVNTGLYFVADSVEAAK